MTSEESELKDHLLARARLLLERAGGVSITNNMFTGEPGIVRHWRTKVNERTLSLVVWETGGMDIRLLGGHGFNTNIIYNVFTTANEEEDIHFDPKLARLALEVIDRYMVLDDLADA